MKRYSVAIVGCGALGTHHAYGVSKSQLVETLYLVDPSAAATTLSAQSLNRLPSRPNIVELTSASALPPELDLAIVATTAFGRLEIVKELLENVRVENLILEKLLEQSGDRIRQLVSSCSPVTNVWVNHSRRMMAWHQRMGDFIAPRGLQSMSVAGPSWGFVTSTTHYMDLVAFWTNQHAQQLHWEIDDLGWVESKRHGAKELIGQAEVLFSGGTRLSLASYPARQDSDPQSTIEIRLKGRDYVLALDEVQGRVDMEVSTEDFPDGSIEMQSDLSASLANTILSSGKCALPSLDEVSSQHILFTDTLKERMMLDFGFSEPELPIS